MDDKKMQFDGQLIVDSGIVSNSQVIYLDFDGADTAYSNAALDLNFDVQVEAVLSSVEQMAVLTRLNAMYQNSGVVFTAEKPAADVQFSTVYVGASDAFDKFGAFLGIAENIDNGNAVKNDNAFVMVSGGMTADKIANVIAHEVGHLLGESHAAVTGTIQDYAAVVQVNPADDDIDGNGLADIVMSISEKKHDKFGSTGAFLIQKTQTAEWGNLSNLSDTTKVLGIGRTQAGKANCDVYILDTQKKVVGAWVTDNAGLVTGWQTIQDFDEATVNVLGLGDFNGDNQTDLLLSSVTGDIGCYFTSGDKPGWNYIQSLGSEWSIASIGDFNNDGRDDLVLENAIGGFAGCWLIQENGTAKWSSLDNVGDLTIIGSGDFNGDGTDDVLLKRDNYYGAWIVKDGNAKEWFGIGTFNDTTVEQIADFNNDGIDDLRIRTATGDIGALLITGADSYTWKHYQSVGSEWNTAMITLQ